MSKKPAALSPSLVAIKGAGAPSPDMLGRGSERDDQAVAAGRPDAVTGGPAEVSADESLTGAPLNFRVPESFRREFKVYAAQHGLKLNELLRRSFEAYRRRNGD